MDIALLQMAQPKVIQPKAPITQSANTQPTSSFEQVLHEAVQTPAHETGKTTDVNTAAGTEATTVEEVVTEVVEVVEAEDLKNLFDILGIEYDESMSFVQIEGELVPIDELMNVEDLTALIGMTPAELQETLSELLGEEVPVDDIWSVLEQSPTLLAQIASVLQGENTNVTPKEAAKVVEFLKIAQVVGLKTDTVYQQEFQLKETKSQLQTFATQLMGNVKPVEPQMNFQQVLQTTQPVVQVTEQSTQQPKQSQQPEQQLQQISTQSNTQQAEVPQSSLGQVAQTPVQTVKTVTVTLPTNPAAQSEALVKEVENAISRSQLGNNQGQMKLLLKLYPENLGQIRVELFHKDGVMQARLLATSGQTKELLDANLNQLKTALAGQNIQMDRIDVAQSLQSSEQSSRDQNFFNNFFRQQQEEQEEHKQEDEEQASFEDFLQQEFITEEV